MNKPLFIILSSVVVLILILVWVYVLLFRGNDGDNNTGASGIFSNLDIGDTTDPTVNPNIGQPDNNGDDQSDIDPAERAKLRQLTTKQVAGYSEINATTTDSVYFIEAGVGHVYEVNIYTGVEKRLSATTFADSYLGDISDDGKHFIIQSGYTNNPSTRVASIDLDTTSATGTVELEDNVKSFSFFADNTVGYTVQGNNSLTVRVFDFKSMSSKTAFTIPFREATIVWGTDLAGPHYVYPSPADGLEGFVYEYSNDKLRRLPVDGFGLSAYGSSDTVIASYKENSKYQTIAYNTLTGDSRVLGKTMFPDKCTAVGEFRFVCGIDTKATFDSPILTRWYQGLINNKDTIFEVSIADNTFKTLIDTELATSRIVDLMQVQQGTKTGFVYFQNKLDRTLWVYEYENPVTLVDNDEDN